MYKKGTYIYQKATYEYQQPLKVFVLKLNCLKVNILKMIVFKMNDLKGFSAINKRLRIKRERRVKRVKHY